MLHEMEQQQSIEFAREPHGVAHQFPGEDPRNVLCRKFDLPAMSAEELSELDLQRALNPQPERSVEQLTWLGMTGVLVSHEQAVRLLDGKSGRGPSSTWRLRKRVRDDARDLDAVSKLLYGPAWNQQITRCVCDCVCGIWLQ